MAEKIADRFSEHITGNGSKSDSQDSQSSQLGHTFGALSATAVAACERVRAQVSVQCFDAFISWAFFLPKVCRISGWWTCLYHVWHGRKGAQVV